MIMIFDLFEILGGEHAMECVFLIFVSLFFAILFLQSGIDKIIYFSDNLNYFKDHFKNTFLKNQVKSLLMFITLIECVTGILFLLSIINLIKSGSDDGFAIILNLETFYFPALIFTFLTLCSLFLGQRIAQDYAGAVNLGIYFLIALIAFSLPVLFLELA